MSNHPTRDDALALLHEYTKSDSLRRHALGVEQAMLKMAEKYGGDLNEWGIAGLLHDFDYEMYPTIEEHPYKGNEILNDRGYSDLYAKRLWDMLHILASPGTQIWPKRFFQLMN